ncbi:hypothetical protein L1889_18115 [Paenalcaligenes niemegkensis]|uniref:hypothetical protein n=1 Tax=Paenalcaligenes niemegkensis TaxID=2895469 RepID=UPI001EE9370C|nr:hypothetical protein [Paenalcaligenes niemegkensis]MCQ9618355.1 hypothetical protein [Paenalcaligenes niemegkensis]
MTKATMPEPVAYAIFAENGNIRIWSREPRDLPHLDSLGPMDQLITTDQAEAYAAAKALEVSDTDKALAIYDEGVRAGLEAAAAVVRATLYPKNQRHDWTDCAVIRADASEQAEAAIVDLIPQHNNE